MRARTVPSWVFLRYRNLVHRWWMRSWIGNRLWIPSTGTRKRSLEWKEFRRQTSSKPIWNPNAGDQETSHRHISSYPINAFSNDGFLEIDPMVNAFGEWNRLLSSYPWRSLEDCEDNVSITDSKRLTKGIPLTSLWLMVDEIWARVWNPWSLSSNPIDSSSLVCS